MIIINFLLIPFLTIEKNANSLGEGRGDVSEGELRYPTDPANAMIETPNGVKLKPISIEVVEQLLHDQHIFSCVTKVKRFYNYNSSLNLNIYSNRK